MSQVPRANRALQGGSKLPLRARLRNGISALSGGVFLLTAGALLALSIRFTWTILSEEQTEQAVMQQAASAAPSGFITAPPPKKPAHTPKPANHGASVRLTLSISAGVNRSEVYINGSKRGNTPFLGDVSCKTGEPLKIQVMPEKGTILNFERTCRSGTMSISEPDED